ADPTYWQDVRPVLRRHCTVCHNARTATDPDVSGGVALDTYAAVLKWKDKKVDLVKPGKSGDSPLFKAVTTDDEEKRMPLGGMRLFTTDGWKLKAVLGGHEDVVNSVAFDRDGKRLVSASYDRTARVWDVATGKSLRTLTMHSDFVLAAAFSPDGKHVYTGSKD